MLLRTRPFCGSSIAVRGLGVAAMASARGGGGGDDASDVAA
jgi:hypothetical protein